MRAGPTARRWLRPGRRARASAASAMPACELAPGAAAAAAPGPVAAAADAVPAFRQRERLARSLHGVCLELETSLLRESPAEAAHRSTAATDIVAPQAGVAAQGG